MSQQSDVSIANQGFADFRSELNLILAAFNTNHSGSSRPSSAVAGSFWLDSTSATAPILKHFDGSDDITIMTFNYSANTVDMSDSAVTLAADSVTVAMLVGGVLTDGFAGTDFDLGTNASGTETLAYTNGNFQKGVNGGAHTLAPQATTSTIIVQYTNDGSAGTLTTSGYTIVTGDSLTTTSGHDFMLYSTRLNSFKHLHIVALQ